MKKLFVFFAVLCCACSKTNEQPSSTTSSGTAEATVSATRYKRIYLKQGTDKGVYINGTQFNYSAGDTLVVKGNWSYCSLENFYGKTGLPVVILNENLVNMTNGFALINCRNIKLTGKGTSSITYGFRIATTDNSGVGITIGGRSSDIEVSNVDISHKLYGYWVKEDGSCVDSLQYPNWTIMNIHIHDGRIRNVNQEGMYMGSTDPNGGRAVVCNGVTKYPKPLRLGHITVNNMIIDSTYRSGIQLSGADQGKNEIYNNTISNCGLEFNTAQGNGIVLGGYTHALVHDNYIKNTYTMGIFSLGSGEINIYNNTINTSGNLAGRTVNGMASIMVDTRPTSPVDSSRLTIKNNKLGSNTDFGIRIYKTYSTYSTSNFICGNTGTLSVAAGIKWTQCQ